MKKDLPYISFARMLAILLVVNSHATGLWPSAVANVAGRGGGIGNALFFFVSGFALYLSLEARGNVAFRTWLPRRLFRIWPSVWICYGILVLTGTEKIPWHDFFLPLERNWFLGAILVFYPLFFFCIKFLKEKLPALIAALFAIFVAAFFALESDAQRWVVGVGSPWMLHWIYYFGIMIFGAELAKRSFFEKKLFAEGGSVKTLLAGAAFAGTVCLYYAMRGGFEMTHLWRLQFLAPFALPAVCVAGIAFCRICEASFPKIFSGNAYKAISFVSNRTLEIYLVHTVGLALCGALPFPLNLATALAVTLVLAAALKFCSGRVSRLVGIGR